MRRNSGIAAIVGLIALVLLPMAALAIAPIAIDLPDIRGQVISTGNTGVVLDLDQYAIDADSRNQATSAQSSLTWTETGTNVTVSASNDLQLVIPTGSAAVNETAVVYTVSDGSGSDSTNPCRVHTATALLGGPLVDTQIGGGAGALIPYTWAVEGAQTGTLEIPFSAGGASALTVTKGFSRTLAFAASQVVADTANPLAPYYGTVTTVGQDTTAPLGVNAGNLSIDADLNGLAIVPLTGFSGWARVTVTRQFAANDDDSYTVAIADFLNGTNSNLSGLANGDSTISTVAENYNFEDLSMTELIGFETSAAFNTADTTARRTAVNGQSTNWLVYPTSYAAGAIGVYTLPGMDITSTGKPAATYPGATSGNALKLTFDSPDKQNVYMQHKGIPTDQYDPGDVLTFSLNAYFDLGYAGTAADDMINEPTNGLSLIMGLITSPGALSQNLNIIASAPDPSALAGARKGGSLKYGAGGGQIINPIACLAGKWTRQEVSFRVPEFGQAIVGDSGTGNVADNLGMAAQLYIGRNNCEDTIVDQVVWLDNLSITKCPGALALAYGSIEVPMISAGFSDQFISGGFVTPGYASIYGTNLAQPAALARGQVIYGTFSQGGTGSTETVTGRVPATVFGAAPVALSDALNTAKAGFLEVSSNTDMAIIGTGDTGVALAFPVLDDGYRALVLGPAAQAGNAFTTPISAVLVGKVKIQTPFLDMRLASAASAPGLRVSDVNFLGGTGGNANGEDGDLNPNKILGNVSGVYGVRWFTKSNAPSVPYNPQLSVQLLNGDQMWGLVATRTASVLPSDDNSAIADDAWSDDYASASFVSFNSNRRYYDLVLNNQTGGRAAIYGKTPAAMLTDLTTNNPGAQMASLVFSKGSSASAAATISTLLTNATANGFDGIFTAAGSTTAPDANELPGTFSSAVLSIDEVHFLSVRDSAAFFDEDLQ